MLDALVPGDKAAAERISPALRDIDCFGRLSDCVRRGRSSSTGATHSWHDAPSTLAAHRRRRYAAAVGALDGRVAAEAQADRPRSTRCIAGTGRRGPRARVARPGRRSSPRSATARSCPHDPQTLPFGDLVAPPIAARAQHTCWSSAPASAGSPRRTSWPSAASRSPCSTTATASAARPAATRSAARRRADARGLPGEHGFRFFAGFYRHVIDTMSRIATADGTVLRRPASTPPASSWPATDHPAVLWEVGPPRSLDEVRQFIDDLAGGHWGLSVDDVAHLAECIITLLTSCDDRYFGEWEDVSWWDFVGAGDRSPAYQQLVGALTRPFVAAVPHADEHPHGRSRRAPPDRCVDGAARPRGPRARRSDERGVDRAVAHHARRARCARSTSGSRATALRVEDGRITGVEVVASAGAAHDLAAPSGT